MFTRRHIAAFIDGCSFRRCPSGRRENGGYCRPKLARNRERAPTARHGSTASRLDRAQGLGSMCPFKTPPTRSSVRIAADTVDAHGDGAGRNTFASARRHLPETEHYRRPSRIHPGPMRRSPPSPNSRSFTNAVTHMGRRHRKRRAAGLQARLRQRHGPVHPPPGVTAVLGLSGSSARPPTLYSASIATASLPRGTAAKAQPR